MKRSWLMICSAFLLAGCGADLLPPTLQESRATPRAAMVVAATSVTPETPRQTDTPTPDEVGTAYAVIAFDQATSTAEAAATATSAVVTATQEAKATEAFWAGVTMQVATQYATETKMARTQIAGTQQSAYQTAVLLTQTPMEATRQVENAKRESEIAATWIWSVGLSTFVVVVLWTLGAFLWRSLPLVEKYLRERTEADILNRMTNALAPDEKGRHKPVRSSMLKQGETLIMPDLAHSPVIDPSHDALTQEQSLHNANSARMLEGVRVLGNNDALGRALANGLLRQMVGTGRKGSGLIITKPEPTPPAYPSLSADQVKALPIPHYKHLFHWDGELLPYGADANDHLLRVDMNVIPHFMVVGRSGSGKTMSFLRPMVACLLAQGWNVTVMGKRADYLPFDGQVNFKLLAVDVRKDAGKYVELLERMTAQMDKRDQIMAGRQVSTWAQYGAPKDIVIIDDYSGAVERMADKFARQVISEVKQLVQDGRKYGLHVVLGLQKATWDNINTSIRSGMGRIAYSLLSADDSRVVLDEAGAEKLPLQWNFLSRLTDDGSLQRGVGFALQNEEIEAFLKSRPVSENEPATWVDATVIEESAPVTAETVSSELANAYQTADRDFQIRESYLKKKGLRKPFSLRQIEVEVFGSTGGAAHDTVKEVIANLEGCKAEEVASLMKEEFAQWKDEDLATTRGATTGESAPFLADSEPVAA